MRILLFVYGTLRPELAPAAIKPFAAKLTKVAEGSIDGTLYDLGEYPGTVLDLSGGKVLGTIYSVPDRKLLEKFDEYEGVDRSNTEGSLFLRRRVRAQLNSGEYVRCWAYFYNRPIDGQPRISSGIYRPEPKRQ